MKTFCILMESMRSLFILVLNYKIHRLQLSRFYTSVRYAKNRCRLKLTSTPWRLMTFLCCNAVRMLFFGIQSQLRSLSITNRQCYQSCRVWLMEDIIETVVIKAIDIFCWLQLSLILIVFDYLIIVWSFWHFSRMFFSGVF